MNEQTNITLTVGELRKVIEEAVMNALAKAAPQKQEEELIGRQEVASIFRISLVTLNEWMNKGLVPYYNMNRRIYFIRQEVMEAMKKLRKGKNHD